MMDRDKVINALECCTKKACCYNDTAKECPYWELCGEYEDAFEDCTTALAKDALALLKAQEPIVPIRRSAHAQGADDIWYECGKCGEFLGVNPCSKQFCANCGREVKWDA